MNANWGIGYVEVHYNVTPQELYYISTTAQYTKHNNITHCNLSLHTWGSYDQEGVKASLQCVYKTNQNTRTINIVHVIPSFYPQVLRVTGEATNTRTLQCPEEIGQQQAGAGEWQICLLSSFNYITHRRTERWVENKLIINCKNYDISLCDRKGYL